MFVVDWLAVIFSVSVFTIKQIHINLKLLHTFFLPVSVVDNQFFSVEKNISIFKFFKQQQQKFISKKITFFIFILSFIFIQFVCDSFIHILHPLWIIIIMVSFKKKKDFLSFFLDEIKYMRQIIEFCNWKILNLNFCFQIFSNSQLCMGIFFGDLVNVWKLSYNNKKN